jgi:6-phosphogluconolactonase
MNRVALAFGATALSWFLCAGCQDRLNPDSVNGPVADQQDLPSSATVSKSAVGNLQWEHHEGAVYALSNSSGGNSVLRFKRERNGSLTPDGSFPTGGTGTGSGLGSQGAIARSGNFLFVVDAGSNEVTVLRTGGALHVVSRVPSGGVQPISLTVHGDLLYVLNAGDPGSIEGFRGARLGRLHHIKGSSRPLSGSGTGPAQVEFNPRGDILVVTEKNTNIIDTYHVRWDGRTSGPNVQNSTGQTPFGFEFTQRGQLIVSDAAGGAAGLSGLTSYRLSRSGILSVITGPLGDNQTAACWVAISGNGKFAYTTNAGTNNISGYTIGRYGNLTLFGDGGATASTDASPIDLTFSRESRFLYALNAKGNSISIFGANEANGELSPVGKVDGLPDGAAGLIAD